jgi:hypothetical protein
MNWLLISASTAGCLAGMPIGVFAFQTVKIGFVHGPRQGRFGNQLITRRSNSAFSGSVRPMGSTVWPFSDRPMKRSIQSTKRRNSDGREVDESLRGRRFF